MTEKSFSLIVFATMGQKYEFLTKNFFHSKTDLIAKRIFYRISLDFNDFILVFVMKFYQKQRQKSIFEFKKNWSKIHSFGPKWRMQLQ
jgi:hypothetical protein